MSDARVSFLRVSPRVFVSFSLSFSLHGAEPPTSARELFVQNGRRGYPARCATQSHNRRSRCTAVTAAASSRASFSDRHSDAPRQKETVAAAAATVAAEEIAIAAIVFLLAENSARSCFTSRTHSRRTVMNYERYLRKRES